LKKLIRSKGKDVLRVSADQEETRKFGAQLDRAVEELNVRVLVSHSRLSVLILITQPGRFYDPRGAGCGRSTRALDGLVESYRRDEPRDVAGGDEQYVPLRSPVSIVSPLLTIATLAALHPIHSARWDEAGVNPCMESTREQLLSDIMAWAEAPAAPVVFWLNGLAGTGKSTIARTICEHFAKTGLLGASFFLSRQVAERRHAPNVVRSIAYQLARKQCGFADALSAALQDSPDLASSEGLQRLVTEVLFNPASVIAADGRLLLVIDALDECTEDSSGRAGGELLPLLLRGLLQLSGRIKLLITSRAEPEIVRMFNVASLGSQQTVMQLHDLDAAGVRSDIRTYLATSFARIAIARPDLGLLNWPTNEDINALVDLSDVLFVFAATVVRFVGAPRHSPRARLDILLARRESKSAMPYHSLDQLYIQVLKTSVRSDQQEDSEELCERLRNVVGVIVTAQQPLSVAVHTILLNVDQAEVQLTVESLSALVLGTSNEPVRIFHPSFPDFIVNPRRCNDPLFRVSLEEHHLRLACGCLATLNQHLRYNIANLDDPDLPNSYVEDLEDLLLRGICKRGDHAGPSLPQALFYAARHWTTHVVSSSIIHSQQLLDALSRFCDEHLFHWLELLSLIGGLAYGTQSDLLSVIGWSQVDQRFAGDARVTRIVDLLHDTVCVLQTYAEPMRSHALHAFQSAYVTMPHSSLLDTLAQASLPEVKHTLLSPRAAQWGSSGPVLQAGSDVTGVAFVPNQPLIIAGMDSGLLRVWNTDNFEEVAALSGHKSNVMSLAVSSDGSRIVSGSRDRSMCVWDSRTFEEVGLCKHEDEVNSVAFSPDSSLIASGSKDGTVWIWNARSLEKVTRLTCHKKLVSSVAFFPDGTRMASASLDCTVHIWDALSYEPLPGLQCSGPVFSIAISSDSTRLALAESMSSTEGILHVFDMITLAEQAQVSISPGAYLPWAITFSQRGDLLASGTASGTVQVWDASNLSNIMTIKGHHGQVTSIAFSPDGSQQIVSGSEDSTVRIRPVASSEEQLASIPGHDAFVSQAVFSSDGSHLVSGSFDKTVRIWDGLTCQELAVLHGHEGTVWTVAYSPDGTRVVSGSDDYTVRMWNAVDFEEIAVLQGHRDTITFVTFAPDGTQIASCSLDQTVRLWSSSKNQECAIMEGHRAVIWSVAFSSNGTRLVSTSEDQTVRVWDTVNFTQVAELEASHNYIALFHATFSLDGKAILARLWDDGLSWVCSDEDHSEHLFHVCDAR
jgi:WD40 repeat protein